VTLWLILAGVLALALGGGVLVVFGDDWFSSIAVGVLLCVTGVCLLVVPIVRVIDHLHEVRKCDRYEEQTDTEVRFMDFSYWSYHCMVHTDNGWVPVTQIRDEP
jgi:hypothetical protein